MRPDFSYKLAAIDLDDTLLGPTKEISPANAEAVRRLREYGLKVILASGRAYRSMLPAHHQLGLAGLMVALNGAVIARPSRDEFVQVQALPSEVAFQIADRGLRLGMTIVCCCLSGNYASVQNPLLLRHQARGGEKDLIIGLPDDWSKESVLKLIWIAGEPDLDRIQREALRDFSSQAHGIRTESQHLEFMRLKVDKATGVQAVAEMEGVAREEVITFGDGSNDAGMLKWAGLGVAMGHAMPEAREAADLIGPTGGEPGEAFAAAVRQLLL